MLSEKVYTLRRKSGLSQEQLAEKIGVSRQAVSKWEGGLSTPELDKLKALSDCFQVSIDELTCGDSPDIPTAKDAPQNAPTGQTRGNRLGIVLCLVGAVCLILLGVLMVARPSAVEQLSQSSMVTLNGSGLLVLLFVLLMAAGLILIFRKK